MSQRLTEYFAGEAADYLQQLAVLLSAPVPPDPVRLLRLVTGVRGSTQMAGADDLADLATHFEASAREYLQGETQWSDDVGELTRRTVGEMQALVYSIGRWGEEEASRIRAVQRLWSGHEVEDGGGANGLPVVPVESLYFDDDGPHIIEPEASQPNDLERVPIEQLLYSGASALKAARALRSEIESLASSGDEAERLLLLVDELFDLIDLGIGADALQA